ncbi:MAG: hypothetical protein WCS70_15060 [Verrucomicrobiota bacterium]
MKPPRELRLAVAVVAALGLVGCATPVGVDQVGQNAAYSQITANVITPGVLSAETITVLQRYDLAEQFANSPVRVLQKLHAIACQDPRADVLYALAELNFFTAQSIQPNNFSGPHAQSRPYYLAAATYAYLYLFPPGSSAPLDPLDRRTRVACDMYNRGLGHAFKNTDQEFAMAAGVLELPTGQLNVAVSRPGFPWDEKAFSHFVLADDYLIRGISPRNRDSGLGVPLIGWRNAGVADPLQAFEPGRVLVPATAFLRINGGVNELASGKCTAALELYSTFDERTITVDGRPIRLEADISAPVAYALNKSLIAKLGITQLLSGVQKVKSGVYITQPYQPGRIPVVFVHGTASDPAIWGPMLNGLRADPALRDRYQFWYFLYNTGEPIAYSAYLLRNSLASLVKTVDPDGKDPALQQMVMVGHSQGGVLTKLQVVNTGDKLWRGVMNVPFDQLKLEADERQLLQSCMFISTSPYIRRVVFISTPHRGSYRARGFIEKLANHLISLPGTILSFGTDLFNENPELKALDPGGRIANSIDNQSPKSPLLKALVEIPLAPDVIGHSIIPDTQTNNNVTASDGVVMYSSAHLEGMQSEFRMIGTHSCEGTPLAIEEVRRILLEHLHNLPPAR